MLNLPIRKETYQSLLSGSKKELALEMNKYYESRFRKTFGKLCTMGRLISEETEIRFQNRSRGQKRSLIASCTMETAECRGKRYFLLRIKTIKPEN